MQLSAVLSLTILWTITAASQIQLSVRSTSSDIDNTKLIPVHEGAGINYIRLDSGSPAYTLEFNENSGVIYKEIPGTAHYESFRFYLSVADSSISQTGFPFLQLSVAEPNVKWSSHHGHLVAGDGNDKFFAATNVNDPYRYSERSYFVGVSDDTGKAIEVDISVTYV